MQLPAISILLKVLAVFSQASLSAAATKTNKQFFEFRSMARLFCSKIDDSLLSRCIIPFHLLMKNQVGSLLTPSYGCQPQTVESSKLSRVSMTSEQRKLYQSGMFFPEKVIYTAKVDVRNTDGSWEQGYPLKLTSQAFGFIPITTISKIKYYSNNESGKLVLKIIASDQETYFQVRRADAGRVFSLLAWGRLATMNIFPDMDATDQGSTKGSILKKSYIFKSWEPRCVTISKEKGLEISKKEGGPAKVMLSSREIWTRFETIKNESYLVIKLWNGLIKQEYAVPAEDAVRWMQSFTLLLQQ